MKLGIVGNSNTPRRDSACAGRSRGQRVAVWMMGVGLAVGCTLLGGCATTGAMPGGGMSSGEDQGSHIMTASDESEAYRRARIRLELASSYLERGQMHVALDEVKQALSIEPNYVDAYNLRGLIFMRMNDPQLAQDSFQRAAALRPNDPDVAHNHGWLLCQQKKFAQSEALFEHALAQTKYLSRSKTLMALGLCQEADGKLSQAEHNLNKSYELDPGNPLVGYNLARLLYQRGEQERAQFYIRRLNNSELANAQSLWLGIKVERALANKVAVQQLADQLQRRYSESPEYGALKRGAFHE